MTEAEPVESDAQPVVSDAENELWISPWDDTDAVVAALRDTAHALHRLATSLEALSGR